MQLRTTAEVGFEVFTAAVFLATELASWFEMDPQPSSIFVRAVAMKPSKTTLAESESHVPADKFFGLYSTSAIRNEESQSQIN